MIGNARTHKPSFGFPQKANDVGQSYPTLCNGYPTGKGKGGEENTEFKEDMRGKGEDNDDENDEEDDEKDDDEEKEF